jgi:hypothetical protein
MSSKAISKMVTGDVDKTLANIGSMRPDMKADDAVKAAAAPQKAPSFAEAFRAARKDPEAMKRGNFTFGGKSYSTKMAGEGVKRPAAPAATRSAPKVAAPTASPTNTRAQMEMRRTATRSQEAIRDKRAENQADFRKRMQEKRAGAGKGPVNAGRSEGFLSRFGKSDTGKSFKERQEQKYGKPSGRAVLLTGKEAREANKRQGTIGGYAKGGSVDGCAIRGKTRAPMKKGK